MTVPKKDDGEEKSALCPECHQPGRDIEASVARFEHLLSIGRSRGEKRLKQHLIEQFGEEGFQMSYGGVFSHICRTLLVESWREELREAKKA